MWQRIWKFLCDQDYLIVVIPMIIMDILFWHAGLTYWALMFLIIGVIFGLTELVAYLTKHKTISQQFAKFRDEHKVAAWCIIWSMLIFWMCLVCHLLTTGS